MAYYLGVDIGTTYTAAAVWREGRVEIASLGNRAPVIPSVVLLRDDGSMLVGEAAERRAAAEPQRVARQFKRRLGDPTPLVIGGTPYSADALMAKVLRWVVDRVSETQGGPPTALAVSHPANWGAFKKDLLQQAIAQADLDHVATVTEPEAAAIHYASQERVEPGSVVAVYDLGGGTFDAAVLRKTARGWEILGEPQGVEHLGGVDFDEAVFRHVLTAVGDGFDPLDHLDDDPAAVAAVARLRQDCVEAKEALSADTDVSIPVLLPTVNTEVRLTRSEFENMVRPALASSITALDRALRAAGLTPADVTAVLLVGGSSRLPIVSQLVGSELGRPVAVDAHPKYSVALGAAIVAAGRDVANAAEASQVAAIPEDVSPTQAVGAAAAAGAAAAGVAAMAVPPPTPPVTPPPPTPLPPTEPIAASSAPPYTPPPTQPFGAAPPIPPTTPYGSPIQPLGSPPPPPPGGMAPPGGGMTPAGGMAPPGGGMTPGGGMAPPGGGMTPGGGVAPMGPPSGPAGPMPGPGYGPPGPRPSASRLPLWLALGGLVLVAAIVGGVIMLSNDDDPEPDPGPDTQPTSQSTGADPSVTSASTVGDADLDALEQSCSEGNMADCDALYFATPAGSDLESFARTCGDIDQQVDHRGTCEDDYGASASAADVAEYLDLGAGCASGVMADCDSLYRTTPSGSGVEAYALSCGERDPGGRHPGTCESEFGANATTTAPSADIATLHADCEGGSMAACDDLYYATPYGSEEEAFAMSCGGRETAGVQHRGDCERTFG